MGSWIILSSSLASESTSFMCYVSQLKGMVLSSLVCYYYGVVDGFLRWPCDQEMGTRHLPLHALNHEPLQLPTRSIP